MGNHADSEETKALKKKIMQDFIRAVETGGTKLGPKALEYAFDIGGKVKRGSTWCTYRRGERTMFFPTLRMKIGRAVSKGFISKMKGDELLSQLPPEDDLEPTKPAGEAYTFDATRMFYFDVNQTAELLVKQIRELRTRICYGNEELENAHYLAISLDLLEPVKALVANMFQEMQAEELLLKTKFGKENYKDIAPSTFPKNASAWDVGYTPDWWMRPPPSAAETKAVRYKMETEVTRKLKVRRKK